MKLFYLNTETFNEFNFLNILFEWDYLLVKSGLKWDTSSELHTVVIT